MSERTCQLCGKPLSRIRVGGGEEFCSREHRTQYRLRRGMDRLQEANKVASLMRRRENPKPIAVSPVAERVWRGYFKAMPNTNRTLQQPHRTGLNRQVLGLPAAQYVSMPPAGNIRKTERRHSAAPFRPAGVSRLFLPAIERKSGAALVSAGAVMRAKASPASAAQRRSQQVLGKSDAPKLTMLKPGTLRARHDGAAAAAFRDVLQRPANGAVLRVSRSVGFRLQAPGVLPLTVCGPSRLEMTWPGLVGQENLAAIVGPRREAEPVLVPFPKRTFEPDCSWRPRPDLGPGMRDPEPRALEAAIQNTAAASHAPGPIWNLQRDPMPPRDNARNIGNPQLGSASRLVPLTVQLAVVSPAQRISVFPFGSGDITLSYSEEEHSIQ